MKTIEHNSTIASELANMYVNRLCELVTDAFDNGIILSLDPIVEKPDLKKKNGGLTCYRAVAAFPARYTHPFFEEPTFARATAVINTDLAIPSGANNEYGSSVRPKDHRFDNQFGLNEAIGRIDAGDSPKDEDQ